MGGWIAIDEGAFHVISHLGEILGRHVFQHLQRCPTCSQTRVLGEFMSDFVKQILVGHQTIAKRVRRNPLQCDGYTMVD